MMTIDKDIPPPVRKGPLVATKTPTARDFARMEQGDSIFFTGNESDRGRVATVQSKMRHDKRTRGAIFTTRKVEGGWRVWRVE